MAYNIDSARVKANYELIVPLYNSFVQLNLKLLNSLKVTITQQISYLTSYLAPFPRYSRR